MKSLKICETENYVVFIIFCNAQFLDGGGPFMGDCAKEKDEILSILQTYFV